LTPQFAPASSSNRVTRAGWALEPLPDDVRVRHLAGESRDVFPELDMNYDVEWLAIAHGWPENQVLVLADRDDGRLVGLATFLLSRSQLAYALGQFVFLRVGVRQFKLFQGIVSRKADAAPAVDACFEALSKMLTWGAVVFVGAVPNDSVLHAQLTDRSSGLRRRFHTLAWGGESLHCRIRWEGSVEKYLASIGKKSGKELQRNAKNLFADPQLECEVRRFQLADDVEMFLKDGVAVSDKTYQKRDLGLGISRGGAVERLMRFAAARGDFFGYILYINGMPVAFRYGFKCGNTCTMKQTGYDPAWAGRQIGSVLFLEVMRDFERIKLPVEWLDFMPDINLFKLRTTNDKRRIRHFYLFQRTFLGTLQYLTLKATDWLSRAVGALVKNRREGELEKYLARGEGGHRSP